MMQQHPQQQQQQQPSISNEGRARLKLFASKVRKHLTTSMPEMDLDDLSGSATGQMNTDDLLTCSICLEKYQEGDKSPRQPKILPCFHTFCKKCLEQMVIQQKPVCGPSRNSSATPTGASTSSHGSSSSSGPPIRAIISCPQCRRMISIPNGGPSAFQTNFYVLQMTDLMREVNRTGSAKMSLPSEDSISTGMTSVRSTSSLGTQDNVETCEKHSKWPLLFYCKKCANRICSNCTVLDHKESEGHSIVDVQDVVDEAMKGITEKLDKIEIVVQNSKAKINKGQSELSHLNVAEDAMCHRLTKIGEHVAKLMATRLRKLQDSIRTEMLDRRQNVRNQTCDLIEWTRALEKKRRDISERASVKSPGWILDGKAEKDLEEITEIAEKLCEIELDPCYFLMFNDNTIAEEEMQVIFERLIPAPTRRLLPSSVEIVDSNATAGQNSYVTMRLKDSDDSDIKTEEYPVKVSLKNPDGEIIPILDTTFKIETGTYTSTFLTPKPGNYGVQLELNGFMVDSIQAQFTAQVNEPIHIMGQRGTGDGQFNKPVSVIVSQEDEALLVAEFENQRIQIFDPTTFAFKHKFSVAGENGRNYPGSIAIYNAGDYREVVCPKVTMADEGRLAADTIQFFHIDTGQLQTQFQNKNLRKALHVAVDSNGRIIVSDRDANRLFVFNREGALLNHIGRPGAGPGAGPGQFNCPVFVACGLEDSILVADSANNRVQILNKSGQFKAEIGTTANGRLGAPAGISVDRFGNVLVADSQNNRIQMYDQMGQYKATLQPQENALSRPRGVAAWATDGVKRVFVIDRGNHTVKALSYL